MVLVKRLVLDVLKPHSPNGLEFSRALAEQGPGYFVKLSVVEIDEKTETIELTIEAENIDFEAIEHTINALGGSLHSIDDVEVVNAGSSD